MDRRSTARRFLATLALASLLGSLPGSAAPLCIDGVNPQYFYFNGKTTALVGYSPEYICHIELGELQSCIALNPRASIGVTPLFERTHQ